jgi:hypothetical protein
VPSFQNVFDPENITVDADWGGNNFWLRHPYNATNGGYRSLGGMDLIGPAKVR